jgi:hypothetical protein
MRFGFGFGMQNLWAAPANKAGFISLASIYLGINMQRFQRFRDQEIGLQGLMDGCTQIS